MRKRSNFFKWALVLVFIFFLLNIFTPFSSSIRESFLSLFAPLQKTMIEGGGSFFSGLHVIQNTKEIKEEINSLRKENNFLLANLSDLRELEKENEALRKALDIEIREERDFVFGEVVGRNLLKNRVILRHSGEVEKNDPVITPEGILIGVIENSYDNFSQVMLITDKESNFEVRVQNEEEPIGILKGRNEKLPYLDLLKKDKEINIGDTVVGMHQEKSAMGGIYIGRIIEIKDSDVEAFMQAKIWQGIDYRLLDYLLVVRN